MWEKKRVYILVKTYPTISKEYSELVCTAGLLEDGSWIRLYPVPFRKLQIEQQYPKYTWTELEAKRNISDFRLETYRPRLDSIKPGNRAPKADWDVRRRIILGKTPVYTDMTKLISNAKDKTKPVSLAIFKPTELIDFTIEEDARDWDPNTLSILKNLSMQQNLFQTPEEIENEFKLVNKVPYKFSYVFKDCNGRQSKLMIEDWEVGMLYFHCLTSAGGDEAIATQKVKEKYFDYYKTMDLHFFLGTTLQWHYTAKNPFIIIGTFAPPCLRGAEQLSLI